MRIRLPSVLALSAVAALSLGVLACTEREQDQTAAGADAAGDNAEVAASEAGQELQEGAAAAGEVLESGAMKAAQAVEEGAGNLADRLEEIRPRRPPKAVRVRRLPRSRPRSTSEAPRAGR